MSQTIVIIDGETASTFYALVGDLPVGRWPYNHRSDADKSLQRRKAEAFASGYVAGYRACTTHMRHQLTTSDVELLNNLPPEIGT